MHVGSPAAPPGVRVSPWGMEGVGIADGEFTDQAEGRVWEAGHLQRSGCSEEGHELYMAWAWLRWGL